MASKYYQVSDGETIALHKGADWNFACCDCGLVHTIKLKNHRDSFAVTIRRNKRKTAAYRRWNNNARKTIKS